MARPALAARGQMHVRPVRVQRSVGAWSERGAL